MRKVITINIPEPCHEDWNKMTPKDQGRHCASCNKTVVDFTKQTDEQIIKSLESKGNLCGRFKTQQIDRDIVLARKDKNNYWSIAASGLFAFMALGSQDAFAQGEPKPIKTDTLIRPMVKGKVATSVLNERVYIGTIKTKSDNLPLPGANVIVKGTSGGTQTDFDGNFSIKAKQGDTILVSYVGLETKTIVISTSNNLNVSLESDKCYDENFAVGFYITQSNYSFNKCKNEQRRAENKTQRRTKRKAIKNGDQERTMLGKFFFGIKRLFTKK